MARYPDYLLYVTLHRNNLKNVTEFLMERGISQDKIRYTDKTIEWRKGCRSLEYSVSISSGFRPCCNNRNRFYVPYSEDLAHDFQVYMEKRAKIIRQMRNHMPVEGCDDCPEYEFDAYHRNPEITAVGFGGFIKDERCNSKCIYCSYVTEPNTGKYTIIEMLNAVGGLLPDDIAFGYASEEITVSPHKEKVFDFLARRNWHYTSLITNAILYENNIESHIPFGVQVTTSLDCGTKETYEKVHGVNCFEKVLDNLKRYKQNGAKIQLKYILMDGINDCYQDIDEFLSLCEILDSSAWIQADTNEKIKGLSENYWKYFAYFVHKARSGHIPVLVTSEHYNNIDWEKTQSIMKSCNC